MKICVITSNRNNYASQRIFAEGKKRGHQIHIAKWEELSLQLNKGCLFFVDKKISLDSFDAIIQRNNRYSTSIKNNMVARDLNTISHLLAEYAHKKNIFFLNQEHLKSYQSLDKLAQQFFFSQNNIHGIDTYYFSDIKNLKSKKIITFPLVAKMAKGSKGAGVYKLNTKQELADFIDNKNQSDKLFLFQKYYPIACDYRVIVVGNKVLGTMRRSSNKKEWRTNFSLGGKVEPEKRDSEMERLALKTARKMKFDFVGIDILKNKDQLHIIETNTFPQFKGFESVFPQVNVACEIIKLIERRASKRLNKNTA